MEIVVLHVQEERFGNLLLVVFVSVALLSNAPVNGKIYKFYSPGIHIFGNSGQGFGSPCSGNRDCPNDAPLCNRGAGRRAGSCVECFGNRDCPDRAPFCDRDGYCRTRRNNGKRSAPLLTGTLGGPAE